MKDCNEDCNRICIYIFEILSLNFRNFMRKAYFFLFTLKANVAIYGFNVSHLGTILFSIFMHSAFSNYTIDLYLHTSLLLPLTMCTYTLQMQGNKLSSKEAIISAKLYLFSHVSSAQQSYKISHRSREKKKELGLCFYSKLLDFLSWLNSLAVSSACISI